MIIGSIGYQEYTNIFSYTITSCIISSQYYTKHPFLQIINQKSQQKLSAGKPKLFKSSDSAFQLLQGQN